MIELPQSLETPMLKIDHPAHPDWYSDGLALMATNDSDEYRALKLRPEYQALQERFGSSDDVFRHLIHNLGAISIHVDTKRMTNERANVHLLDVAAGGVVSHEALDEYHAFAGRPERAGEYIAWFARVATAAYANYFRIDNEHNATHPEGEIHDKEGCRNYLNLVDSVGGANNSREAFRKISLDLGGKRQSGDWSNTGDLDVWAENLSTQITEADPRADITLTRSVAAQMRGYKLYPWRTRDDNGTPDSQYTSATIRRRRREAVISIPGLRQIVIIKESKGWIPPGEIENDHERNLIISTLENWSDSQHGYEDSDIARIAGKVFERAIHNRDTTREVIPTHAHYYMQASRDLHEVPPIA